jgi:hypothetical protein
MTAAETEIVNIKQDYKTKLSFDNEINPMKADISKL